MYSTKANVSSNVRKLVLIGILGALTVVLGLTPLGFIPLGPVSATTLHIPVIVAGIIEGPIVGALVGLIFGLSSLFNAITKPTPTSFMFYNPLISILPRVLIGVVSYYVYNALKNGSDKRIKIMLNLIWAGIIGFLCYGLYTAISAGDNYKTGVNTVFIISSSVLAFLMNKSVHNNFAIAVSAFTGSFTNTVLVLGGISLFYAEQFGQNLNPPISASAARSAISMIALTSGFPEGIMAVIIVSAIVTAVKKSHI